MAKHSKFSPSSAYRWLNCSGSVLLPKDEVETDTTAAETGSLVHKIAELELTGNLWQDNSKEISELKKDPRYTPELERALRAYLEFVKSFNLPDRYIEERVEVDEDIFGTCDCILMDPYTENLKIIDLKTGRRRIHAVNNPQLKLYALGAAKLFIERHPEMKDRNFSIDAYIFQPLTNNSSESDHFTYKALQTWYQKQIRPAVKKIKELQLERNAGSWCRYCDRQIRCKAYNDTLTEINIVDFFTLTDEDIVANYEKLKEVESMLKKLRSVIINRLESGEEVPGYKLSETHKRVWNETEDLKNLAKEYKLYELPSVAKAERQLGRNAFKEQLEKYVKTINAGMKLVREKE